MANRVKDKNDPNDDTQPDVNGNISKFYWVVTAIDTPHSEHRWRFHLATKAGKMNKPSVSEWYTAYTYNLNVFDDPPQEVIDDSSDLIGITTKMML